MAQWASARRRYGHRRSLCSPPEPLVAALLATITILRSPPAGGRSQVADSSSFVASLLWLSSSPALNSFWAWPRERASFGIFAPPKMMTTTSRMIRSSGAPRFIADVLSGSRDRDHASLLGDRGPLRRPHRLRQQVDVVGGSDVERNGAGADDERLHPEFGPGAHLLPDLLGGPDEPAPAPLLEGHPVEHAGGGPGPEPLEAPLEIGLVLAAERVEPEGAPDRRRVAADPLALPQQHLATRRVLLGGPHPAGVPPVGAFDDHPEQAVALAADEDRGPRPLHRGGQVPCAVGAVVAAGVDDGAAVLTEHRGQDVDRLAHPGQPDARRRELHADGRVLRLVPPRAHPDVDAPAGDAVQGGERLREHRRRPQRLAEHEGAEADAVELSCEGRERDDGFERGLRTLAAAVLR